MTGLGSMQMGSPAAIATGYSEKSAGVMAHRLRKNPAISKELGLFSP
jgi:phage terminase small subunit